MMRNRSVSISFAVLATALLLAAVLIQTAAFCACKIGPEMGPEIERLIYGGDAAAPLPDGWRVTAHRFTDLDIHVQLENPAGSSMLVRLALPPLPSARKLLGMTRSFRVELVSGDGSDPGAMRVADAFFERVREGDGAEFLQNEKMIERQGRAEFLFMKYVFPKMLFAMLAAIFILLVLNSGRISNLLFDDDKRVAAAVLALAAAALILRLLLAPQAPIHANGHGYTEIRAIVFAESVETKEILYGTTYPAMMRWINRAAEPRGIDIFVVNIIFGALGVISMFLLAKSLLRDDRAAFFAAALLCFNPSHIMISGTESPVAAFLFFGPAGAALIVPAVKKGSLPLLWLATLLISVAATLKLLTLLMVPVAVLFYIYSIRGARLRNRAAFSIHSAACLLFASGWAFAHCLSISRQLITRGTGLIMLDYFTMFFKNENILFDPSLTLLIIPVLALAGWALMWKRDARLAVLLTVCLLMVMPPGFMVIADRTDAVRYQTAAQWALFLLAAVPLTGIRKLKRPTRAAAASLVIIAALALPNMIYSYNLLAAGNEDITEYRFIRRSLRNIDRNDRIRIAAAPGGGEKMNREFPDYLGKRFIARGPAEPGTAESIYIGLYCYRYGSDEEMETDMAPGGIRKECRDICGGTLETLFRKEIIISYPAIGFRKKYFLTGTDHPVIGFYRCK